MGVPLGRPYGVVGSVHRAKPVSAPSGGGVSTWLNLEQKHLKSAPCGGGGPCASMVEGSEAVRPNAFDPGWYCLHIVSQLEVSAIADNPLPA